MRRSFLQVLLAAFLVVTGVAGCVTTTVQLDWRDPAYTGKIKKVLVVCIAQEQTVRETLEADIAAQFSARGVAAAPSYSYFPTLSTLNRSSVLAKVREIDVDGIFLVRPVGKSTMETNFDTEGPLWYDRLGPVDLGDSSVDIYRVETSLHDTASGKAVWRALSDTMTGRSWLVTLRDFARIMVARLGGTGLI